MTNGHPKKLFTAELQKLKAKGAAIADTVAPTAGSGEVMEAISSLREDIRSIERLLRADEASQAEAEADAANDELPRKRAEVNMLKTEVRALAVCIEKTKSEIAALRPAQSSDDRLIAVTNELDAIVTATERATHGILEAAEHIDGLTQQLIANSGDSFVSRVADEIGESVVSIFENCNFQDITGQRISKAVKTLEFIEDRINKMIDIWGADTFADLPSPTELGANTDDDRRLLNGPALENQGISQEEIDKLFG
jgi:chemotaxis protein CheZ